MNHIEVLMEYKYMQKSLTQALTTLHNITDNSESPDCPSIHFNT